VKEIGKILTYLAAVLFLGAILAPGLYWAAHALADAGVLVVLRKYPFQKYFNRSLLLCAIALLWPFARWLGVSGKMNPTLEPDRHWKQHLGQGLFLGAGVMALLTIERDGRIEGLARPKTRAGRGLGWVPVIGGGMVFIAFLTENAAENWSALHIEQTLGGSPAHGAMGPATLALTMGVARLVGQGIAGRVRPVVLLTAGAIISAVGAFAVAAAVAPWMAYAGFIVMGIGSSVIAPTAFSLVGASAAPEARARAVARATLFGYLGYFIGPPGFGFIAGSLGLRYAFVFAAVILLLVPVLARIMARRG
jgi:hypothetical protein